MSANYLLGCGLEFSHDGLIPELPRRTTLQVGETCPSLGADKVSVSQSSPCPRSSELGSGPTLEAGLGGWGMEVPPSGCEPHMAEVRPSGSGLVCLEHDYVLPILLVFSVASGSGRSGSGMAQDQT